MKEDIRTLIFSDGFSKEGHKGLRETNKKSY